MDGLHLIGFIQDDMTRASVIQKETGALAMKDGPLWIAEFQRTELFFIILKYIVEQHRQPFGRKGA